MDPLKDRLLALRSSLKLTQERLAEVGDLERVEIVNLEKGRNQATSVRILKGLAKGFGLRLDDMMAFIDGEMTVEQAAARVRSNRKKQPAAAPEERYPERAAAALLAREDGVWEPAIEAVLTEPVFADHEGKSTLWWALRMRKREAEMLEHKIEPSPPPGDIREATADQSGRVLVGKLKRTS